MRSSSPPPSAEALYYEALDLLAKNDAAGAVIAFERCLAMEPEMLDALHGLVRAFQECGRLDDAIAAAQKLAQLDPEEILAHTSLSILYQQKGMIAEAEAEGLKARLMDWKRQLGEESAKT